MFSLSDKIKYYKSRYGLQDGNKRNYAKGFVHGSSGHLTRWHERENKQVLSYLKTELKHAKNEVDRQNLAESISYHKGVLAGYSAKMKS